MWRRMPKMAQRVLPRVMPRVMRTGASIAVLAMTVGIFGCNGDAPVEPLVPDNTTLFWTLEAEHPAIMLSVHQPYDTVQLGAVPKNAFGDVLPLTGTLQYRKIVANDTSFTLTPDGYVTAKRFATSARVEVKLTQDGITHGDTITIMIRDDASVSLIDSLRVRPGSSDSTHVWAGAQTIGPDAFGISNWIQLYSGTDTLSNNQVLTAYSYDNREFIDCLESCDVIGGAYIRVHTYAYGRALKDSVLVRRIDPWAKAVVISTIFPADGPPTKAFSPAVTRIRAGTTLVFFNHFSIGGHVQRTAGTAALLTTWVADSVDIVFDDPTAAEPGDSYGVLSVGTTFQFIQFSNPDFNDLDGYHYPSQGVGGDITAFAYVREARTDEFGSVFMTELDPGWRSRKFTRPGTYHYRSLRYPGVRGTIIVTE